MTDTTQSTTPRSPARRPRWRTTLIMMAILGVMAAAAGWLSAQPLHVATGVIQFIPEQPVIFRELPAHRISDVDAFVEAEYRALLGERVLNRASGLSPRDVQILLDLTDGDVPGRGFGDLPFATDPTAREATLDERLTVASTAGSPFIDVRYSAPDAEEAYVVVQSLLAAYQDTRADLLGEHIYRSIEILRREASELETQIADERQQMVRELGSELIFGDPDTAMQIAREEWLELERRLDETVRELESRGCADAAEPGEDEACQTLRSLVQDGERRVELLQERMFRVSLIRASLDARRHTIERAVSRHDEIWERMQNLKLEFSRSSWAMVFPAQRPLLPSIDQRPWRAGIGGGAAVLLALLLHGVRALAARRPGA